MIDFEAHRAHLRRVAYRMLGSQAEADDAVQEAWLRVDRAAPEDVDNPRGWLTTTVSRICLDMLRSRTSRREEAVHAAADALATTDAHHELVHAETLSHAVLVVLDALAPAERVAFVLHDIVGMAFEDIAPIIDKSLAATRQLASRARRRVQGGAVPTPSDVSSQRRVVESFVAALRNGDVAGLLAILDPDVVVRFTGNDTAHDLRGAEHAANQWAKGAAAFAQYADYFSVALVDGTVGLVMAPKGRAVRALRFAFVGDRIASADIIAEPDVLDALAIDALA